MKKPNPDRNTIADGDVSNQQADEIVALLDALMASGSQHINVDVGEEMKIQTVNSTDCSGRPGACAIPNLPQDETEM